MKVLVVGSGGREHALAWKIRKSPHVSWLGCAPGNEGIRSVAESVEIAADDVEGITRYVHDNEINLTVVGPEAPLAAGIAEGFDNEKHILFGPSKEAAKIEASKAFAKNLMNSADIPTAKYGTFTDAGEAKRWIDSFGRPVVVKASGLAAGKGVIMTDTVAQAKTAIDEILGEGMFGEAGSEIVVEERLEGPEVSLMAIADGDTYLLLAPSQDHKRIGEGDTGPNTGGMGAYAPTPMIDQAAIELAGEKVIQPVLDTMKANGTPYRGVLYAGLMLTQDGPKVLEYNCRFGDPETQVLLPLLNVDLVDLMLAASVGRLGGLLDHVGLKSTEWHRVSRGGYAATVVLASRGYPGSYEIEKLITRVPSEDENLVVFHAGTARKQGNLLTSGGRVMGVTGMGDSLQAALAKAYAGADEIDFEGKTLRRDIGWRVLQA
jgi:phosphoribosylamine--glycine ligase